MNSAVLPLFGLYIMALFTSMAAMELFSSVLALCGLILIARHWQGVKKLAIGPDFWLGLFVVAVFISAALNSLSPKEMTHMMGWCRWVLLLYTFTWLLRVTLTPRLEKWHWWFLLLTIPIGLNSIFQFFTGIDLSRPHQMLDHLGDYYRASGFFKMGLTFAYSIGMIGMTALALALTSARVKNWRLCALATVIFLFTSLSIFLSLTRGAWIALALTTLVGIYIVLRRWFLYLVPPAIAIVALITVTSQTLIQRFQSIYDMQNFSNSTRVVIWKSNLLMFFDHPFFGVGFHPSKEMIQGYYARLGVPELEFFGHAHSDLLQMLSGIGVFGFVSYVGFCFFFLRLAFGLWKTLPITENWYRNLSLGSFLAQIYFHIGGLTQCNFTDGEVNHVLVFLWAITGAIAFQMKGARS